MCSITPMLQLWSSDEHRRSCFGSVLQSDAVDDANGTSNRKLEGVEDVRLNIARAALCPLKWRRTAHRLLNYIMRHQTEVSWHQTINAVRTILHSWRGLDWSDTLIHSCEADAYIGLGRGYLFPNVGEIMSRVCIEKMIYFAFIDVCVNFDMLMLNHKLLMSSGDMGMMAVVMLYDVSEVFVVWPPRSLESRIHTHSFPLYFMSHKLRVSRGQMRAGQLICPDVVPIEEIQHDSFATRAPLVACVDVIYDSMALLPTAEQSDSRWMQIRPPRHCVPSVWALCLGNEEAMHAVQKCLSSYGDIVFDLLPYMCVSRCFKASDGHDMNATASATLLRVLQILQRYPHGYEKSCITWCYGFHTLLKHDSQFGDLHNALFVASVNDQQGSTTNTLTAFYLDWLTIQHFVPIYPSPVLVQTSIDDVLLMAWEEPGIVDMIFRSSTFMMNEVVVMHYFMSDVLASDLILTWYRLGYAGTIEPLAFQLKGFTIWLMTREQYDAMRALNGLMVGRFEKPEGFNYMSSDLLSAIYYLTRGTQ